MSKTKKYRSTFPATSSHFDVSSGKNAARFAAIGLSRSTVPNGFKYKIRINNRTLLTSPVKYACEVIPSEVPKVRIRPSQQVVTHPTSPAPRSASTRIGAYRPNDVGKHRRDFQPPPSIRCSFCSAGIFAVLGFFSICWLM